MRTFLWTAVIIFVAGASAAAQEFHLPAEGYTQVLNLPGMFFKGLGCTANTLKFSIYNEYPSSVYADVSARPTGGNPVLPFGLRHRFMPYSYTTWTAYGFDCTAPQFQAMIVNVRFADDKGPEILTYQPVVAASAAAPVAPAPVQNPSNPSGMGMQGTLQYAGPHADAAVFLLQHVGGWQIYGDASKDVFPPNPTSLACQRDAYVYAAVQYAYAANAHVAVGESAAATGNIDGMMQQLRNAASLCSNAPVIAGGGGCQTDWMSCDTLRTFLSE